jgi:hypothetical protein
MLLAPDRWFILRPNYLRKKARLALHEEYVAFIDKDEKT